MFFFEQSFAGLEQYFNRVTTVGSNGANDNGDVQDPNANPYKGFLVSTARWWKTYIFMVADWGLFTQKNYTAIESAEKANYLSTLERLLFIREREAKAKAEASKQ